MTAWRRETFVEEITAALESRASDPRAAAWCVVDRLRVRGLIETLQKPLPRWEDVGAAFVPEPRA